MIPRQQAMARLLHIRGLRYINISHHILPEGCVMALPQRIILQKLNGESTVSFSRNSQMTYFEAICKGKIPIGITFNKYVLGEDKFKSAGKALPAWGGDVIAYPKAKKAFGNGDLVDKESQLLLPASLVPTDARKEKGVVLAISPNAIVDWKGMKLIESGKIIVVRNAVQKADRWGKADPETGVPFEVSKKELKAIPESEKAQFNRIKGAGIRPLSYSTSLDGRVVNAMLLPSTMLDVFFCMDAAHFEAAMIESLQRTASKAGDDFRLLKSNADGGLRTGITSILNKGRVGELISDAKESGRFPDLAKSAETAYILLAEHVKQNDLPAIRGFMVSAAADSITYLIAAVKAIK